MRLTAAVVGAIAGFLAAAVQAFFHVIPPPAYGICIACYVRDLMNWIATHIWTFWWQIDNPCWSSLLYFSFTYYYRGIDRCIYGSKCK